MTPVDCELDNSFTSSNLLNILLLDSDILFETLAMLSVITFKSLPNLDNTSSLLVSKRMRKSPDQFTTMRAISFCGF